MDEKNMQIYKYVINFSKCMNWVFSQLILANCLRQLEQPDCPMQFILFVIKNIYRSIRYKYTLHQEKFQKEPEILKYKYIYISDVQNITIDLIYMIV